jgi:L-threonylcarbamoyladenylate synthase
MVLVEGDSVEAIVNKVIELVWLYEERGKRVGVLGTDETVKYYRMSAVKSLGSRGDSAGLARNLFRLLREFDTENIDVIIAEGVPAEGLGLAVQNRLRRAADYNIIKAQNNSHWI